MQPVINHSIQQSNSNLSERDGTPAFSLAVFHAYVCTFFASLCGLGWLQVVRVVLSRPPRAARPFLHTTTRTPLRPVWPSFVAFLFTQLLRPLFRHF